MAFWIWAELFRSTNWWLQKSKKRVDEIRDREFQRCKAVTKTSRKAVLKASWKAVLSSCSEFLMTVKSFSVQKTFRYNWKTTPVFFWNKQFFFAFNSHIFPASSNADPLGQRRWRLESTHRKWNTHSAMNYNWIKNERHEKNKLWQNSSSAVDVSWIR